jgi:hypothetical protein
VKLFDVGSNNLSGSIPETIRSLENVYYVDFSENKLVGTLPEALASLKQMEMFYINSNSLIGTIPRSFAASDSIISEVWLQDNHFSGTIPAGFAEIDQLDDFYVDGNFFTGTVPSGLCRPAINAAFVGDIYDGILIDNSNMTTVSKGEKDQWCERIACPPGSFSSEGVMPCQPCSEGTETVYLGQNLQCYSTDQDVIIQKLYESTKGEQWSTSATWFYEGYETCDYTGIRCNKAGQITKIELPAMNLKGSIPFEIGFLAHLEILDLSDNYLTGYLPATLANLPLKVLAINGNEIQGPVPPLVCQMPVNGNGVDSKYDCDAIACAVGTYSNTGSDLHECKPCAVYPNVIGRKQCVDEFGQAVPSPHSSSVNPWTTVGISFAVVAGLLVGAFAGYSYQKKRKAKAVDVSRFEEDRVDYEDTVGLHDTNYTSQGRYSDNPEFCDVPVLEFKTPETPREYPL